MQVNTLFIKSLLCLAGYVLLLTGQVFAGPTHVKVVEFIDSVSFKALVDNEVKIIRLAEIICPEAVLGDSPCDIEAKKYLVGKTSGENLTLVFWAMDAVGRSVCEVFLPDGSSLGRLMVAKGFALQDRYYSFSKELHELEDAARVRKVGVWRHRS